MTLRAVYSYDSIDKLVLKFHGSLVKQVLKFKHYIFELMSSFQHCSEVAAPLLGRMRRFKRWRDAEPLPLTGGRDSNAVLEQ